MVTDDQELGLEIREVAVPAAKTGGQTDPRQGVENQAGTTNPLSRVNVQNGLNVKGTFLEHHRQQGSEGLSDQAQDTRKIRGISPPLRTAFALRAG